MGTEVTQQSRLKKLQRHLLRELIEANLLGATIVAFFYFMFQMEDMPVASRRAVVILAAAVFVGFLVVLYLSYRITSPLVSWLAEQHEDSPPERLQIAVVVQPSVHAVLVFSLWVLGATGLGVAQALTSGDDALTRLFLAFAGTLIGGLATAAITYLRVEHTWREWIPLFFPAQRDDPTSLPLPTGGALRTRLHVTFVLGTVVPLLAIALANSFRFDIGTSVSVTQVTWFLAIAGIVMSTILSINVRRSITDPIEKIQNAMDEVRKGNLSASVPVDRVGELGELERGFNEMVVGLHERAAIEDLLNRQVGDKVAERALRDGGEAARLGGEPRPVTALFVDLAAFSTLAEVASPGTLAALLNVVYGVIVDAVEGNEGIVNKFQGDAVLAIFGAPDEDPDHSVHALQAAEEIAGRLEGMELDFGIGISTGEVFAGNVGTETRFEYTVIGDPVNEAARLQELTRALERRILMSAATADAVRERGGRMVSALVPVGPVALRGKTEPTDVHSLSPDLWRGPTLSGIEPENLSGEGGAMGPSRLSVP